MLEVRGLSVGYDRVPVLHEVSLTVDKGEMIGLLGANNAGKSTLIHCLSGLVTPMAGSILLEGEDVTRLPPHRMVERGVAQVPEGRWVFPQMSVRDNLLMGGLNARARPRRAERLAQVLSLLPRLEERLTQHAGTLSGGEQQMLAIGRALMADPKLLMLDEPSLGLSPLFVQHVFSTLKDLHAAGMTILLVEQNLSLTLAHASRCYVLERGRVVVEGPSAQVRDDPRSRKAYLGL